MSKMMVVVALGGVLGYLCFRQVERVEVDSAVASVNRTVIHSALNLPNLVTAAPVMDTVSASADPVQQRSRSAH
jgi:hypothetical protein